MAGEIILIVDKVVIRDDGDVIRRMVVRIAQSTDHLDRMETQVASRRQVEDTELAALRADLESMKQDLNNMLTVSATVAVERAAITALAGDMRDTAQQIRNLTSDEEEGA